MLEHILIKQFFNGLNNEVSRERVILKAPKTLTKAAQFARISALAFRVARNHSAAPSSSSTVSRLDFRGRGSSIGPRGFRFAAVNSRWHEITTFLVADEVAQTDAEHSIRCHVRQALARSSDNINKRVDAVLSATTVEVVLLRAWLQQSLGR